MPTQERVIPRHVVSFRQLAKIAAGVLKVALLVLLVVLDVLRQ